MTVIEKSAAFAGVRVASKLEELALAVVMAAAPNKASKAFKDGVKLLAKNGWTPAQRENWVAERNRNRKALMAPEKAVAAKAIVFDEAMAASVRADWPALELGDLTAREKREEFLAAEAAAIEAAKPKAVKAKEAIAKAKEVEAEKASEPVTDAELKAALEIIKRADYYQAEQLRKAAAEQKKVAPKGDKPKKAKALTPAQQAKADQLAADLKRLGNVIGLIGMGKAGEMAIAVAGIKTPDVKLIIKHHNPAYKLSGVKVAELRAELIGYSDVKHAKSEA